MTWQELRTHRVNAAQKEVITSSDCVVYHKPLDSVKQEHETSSMEN